MGKKFRSLIHLYKVLIRSKYNYNAVKLTTMQALANRIKVTQKTILRCPKIDPYGFAQLGTKC